MNLHPKELKKEAALRLATTPGDHKKIPLLYGGITLGAAILCQLIYLITAMMIDNTGGLSNLGTRTILQTIQSFFPAAFNLLIPILAFGLTQTTLFLVRQQQVSAKGIFGGFSRILPILALYLFIGLTYFVIIYLTMQISVIIFSFTPFAEGLMNAFLPYLEDPALLESALTDAGFAASLLETMAPMLIIWAIIVLLISVPVTYGLRMSFFRIMDEDRPGALRAISQSRRMMRGNKFKLFKLDLSFWWYYLLLILASAILELPRLLPDAYNRDVADLVATVLYSGICLWLYVKFLLQVESSYALFYDTLYEAHKAPQQPPFWQQPEQ